VFQRLNVIALLLLALTGCAGGGTGSTPGGTASGVSSVVATSAAGSALAPSTAPLGTDAAGVGATPGTAILPVGSTAAAAAGGETGLAASAPPATSAEEGAGDDGPVAELPGLGLERGGLGVITADTDIAHLEFGASARRVRATVTRLIGPLAAHRRACPAGRRTVYATRGFSIVALGDHFVGWTDRGAPGRTLSTVDGIAVGLTVAQLEGSATQIAVRPARAGGATWTSGRHGLTGRVTSPSPEGLVTVVSSGETC